MRKIQKPTNRIMGNQEVRSMYTKEFWSSSLTLTMMSFSFRVLAMVSSDPLGMMTRL